MQAHGMAGGGRQGEGGCARAPLPMSEEQRLVWLDLERSPDPCIYNETCTLHCLGDYDHAAMLRSVHALAQRHEILRTSFPAPDGVEPVQQVHGEAPVRFPFHDLSSLPAQARAAEAGRIAAADARAPFDLSVPPLFRGRVFRLGEHDHRLFLTLHHLLFDGDSLQRVLIPELVALYEAEREGHPPALAPLRVQYGDYAAWQQGEAARGRHAAQLGWWQQRLAGELPVLDLPADRPRPAVRSGAGGVAEAVIPAERVARLRTRGREAGGSLYMVVLASYAAALHRWSGQEALTIGGIVSTLRRPELRGTAGLFLNTVVLRLAPAAELPFRTLLRAVRDIVLEAVEHADVPFGEVARSLAGARDGRDGLFRAALSMQPPPPPLRTGWRLTAADVPVTTTKFDLYLEVEERDGALDARLIYSTDLFDAETAGRMLGHWQALLHTIADDPDATLGSVALLAPDEEAAVLRASLGEAVPMAPDTLHGRIAGTIAARPDAIAVVHGDARWRYADLDAHADAVAAALAARGVGAGDMVGLLVERSPAMIAAILGILRCGAAYLPLDPSFPPARLAEIVADASPAVVVTQRSLLGVAGGTPLLIETCLLAPPRLHGRAAPADPEAVAYVIYTSGSTGVPKGVEIAHRSVVNVIDALAREPGFGPDDRLLAVSRLTFDMSVPDLFLPLMTGGTLVVADEGAVTDPDLLRRLLDAHRCTFMQATPATWRSMFASGWQGREGLRILCGGEALPRDLADRILACGMRLWNGYGPTEATIYTTIEPVAQAGRITIGRPLPNVQAIVLDTAGRPVPFNVPGELHIGGAGLARRYRDAGLDRRAFVRIAALGDARFYRSGDIARTLRDGRIEWLGRRDGQVKIRGFRIDLGDVEAALLRHPAVAAATVDAVRAASGLNELAAWIVPKPGQAPAPVAIRDFLLEHLPGYMVPTRYVPLPALPTTSSGKVDKKALPEATEQHRVASGTVADFADAHERRLGAIWADVLGLDTVGPQDDFFDLGGHSLLAARMLGGVAREFGRRLPMAVMQHAATIRRMAALLREAGATPVPSPLLTVQAGADQPPLFWIDAVPHFRQALFRPLARALGPRRPLIGVSLDLAKHGDLLDTDLQAIADDMAGAILTSGAQPPFLVGGYCNGGTVALAVAQRLEALGRAVALVVMVDAANQAETRSRLGRWRRDVERAWRLRGAARTAFLREIAAGRAARVRRRLLGTRDEVDRHLEINDRLNRIVRAHDPPPYRGRVALFRTEEYDSAAIRGWAAVLAETLEVHAVAGGHVSVLQRPAVEDLGRAIAAQLADREGQTSPAGAARAHPAPLCAAPS